MIDRWLIPCGSSKASGHIFLIHALVAWLVFTALLQLVTAGSKSGTLFLIVVLETIAHHATHIHCTYKSSAVRSEN